MTPVKLCVLVIGLLGLCVCAWREWLSLAQWVAAAGGWACIVGLWESHFIQVLARTLHLLALLHSGGLFIGGVVHWHGHRDSITERDVVLPIVGFCFAGVLLATLRFWFRSPATHPKGAGLSPP